MFSRRTAATDSKESATKPAGTAPADSRPEGGPGKGRPTPTRKEAEAKRREAAKPVRVRGAKGVAKANAADRQARLEGIKRGDERFLGPRDAGPVRRLVRDMVDSRLMASEFFLPLAVIVLLCSVVGSKDATMIATNIWALMVVVIGVDLLLLVRRIRKEVGKRFPEAPKRGLGFYGTMRALTYRRFRSPGPTVERGAKV